jgi:hypothetical protein
MAAKPPINRLKSRRLAPSLPPLRATQTFSAGSGSRPCYCWHWRLADWLDHHAYQLNYSQAASEVAALAVSTQRGYAHRRRQQNRDW